jgi:hypothetical protein
MGNKSAIEFFVDINNIFNRRAAALVYSSTADPLDNQQLNYILQGMFNQMP